MLSAITNMEICLILQLLLVGVSCELLSASEQTCDPGEVLQPYTFECDFGQDARLLSWVKDNLLVAECKREHCLSQYPSLHAVSQSGLSTVLSILNVTLLSGGEYSCQDGEYIFDCIFTVYAKPTSVSCQPAVVHADTVTVACDVKRIYPNPVCQFVWTTNGTKNQITQEQITYENLTEAADPDYFNVQCRINLPVLKLSKGSHQFGVFVYPNVTGRDSDAMYGVNSSLTYPQSVAYPSVELESCPGTYVIEGNHFSCTCRETANVFIPANTSLVYGSARVTNTAAANVTGTFIANRDTQELGCQANLRDGTSVVVKHKLLVAYGPTITSFGVDNESLPMIVNINSDVTVTCRAVGNPSPHLLLRKNGREISDFSDPLQAENVVLTFSDHVEKCTDAGVYECVAQTNQGVVNKTMDLNVRCAFQLESTESQPKVYKARMNTPLSIAIPVLGYPYPALKLEGSTYAVDAGTYGLAYVKGTPPYGVIIIRIYRVAHWTFQSYSLRVANDEGTLAYRFGIASEEAEDTSGINVGGAVAGAVAAVLVAVAVVTVIVVLKRKGLLVKCRIKRHRNNAPSQPQEHIQVSPIQYGSQDAAVRDLVPESHYDEISYISAITSGYEAHQPFPTSRNVTNQYENVISE